MGRIALCTVQTDRVLATAAQLPWHLQYQVERFPRKPLKSGRLSQPELQTCRLQVDRLDVASSRTACRSICTCAGTYWVVHWPASTLASQQGPHSSRLYKHVHTESTCTCHPLANLVQPSPKLLKGSSLLQTLNSCNHCTEALPATTPYTLLPRTPSLPNPSSPTDYMLRK